MADEGGPQTEQNEFADAYYDAANEDPKAYMRVDASGIEKRSVCESE